MYGVVSLILQFIGNGCILKTADLIPSYQYLVNYHVLVWTLLVNCIFKIKVKIKVIMHDHRLNLFCKVHHGSQLLDSSGTVQVPLISGNVINIPVERITVTTEPDINISEEMSKTMLWKTIVANESSNSLNSLESTSKKKLVLTF